MKKNMWISCKDGKCDITFKPIKNVNAEKMREALEEFIKEAGVQ